jgi:hypothetical protein
LLVKREILLDKRTPDHSHYTALYAYFQRDSYDLDKIYIAQKACNPQLPATGTLPPSVVVSSARDSFPVSRARGLEGST